MIKSLSQFKTMCLITALFDSKHIRLYIEHYVLSGPYHHNEPVPQVTSGY